MGSPPSTRRVEWRPGAEVTIRLRGAGTPVLLAHGAGTDQDHPLVAGLAEALAGEGLQVVTFNYPYTEMGRRRPDPTPTLLACHRAVAAEVRAGSGSEPVLAGRSMGGRMASILAAGGEPCLGLVLFAYPLHPAGRPDRLRVEHLAEVAVPMLFFQGDRDALARSDLFDAHLRPLGDVVDVPGADHSFRIKGTTREEVNATLAAETAHWISDRFA
jgi:hypothetical protein